MKIKQQKNIKAFLNEEFGEKRGNDLFNKQEAMLNELIKNTQNKSKNQDGRLERPSVLILLEV